MKTIEGRSDTGRPPPTLTTMTGFVATVLDGGEVAPCFPAPGPGCFSAVVPAAAGAATTPLIARRGASR